MEDSSSSDEPIESSTRVELNERSFYTHSSRSHPNLRPGSAFFPPFYNRPPTPLPPSPSLTSLLRPSSFGTHTSRPTSPDSSEVEHGQRSSMGGGGSSGLSLGGDGTGETSTATATSTADAVAKSARVATPVARASPKVPTYEYYGFALYLASSAAFLIYLLWAYLPSPFLHRLGLYYYPNRWWALAIPAWLVVAIAYIYVALASYNTQYLTRPLQNIENVVDEAANIAVVDADGNIVRRRRRRRSNRNSKESIVTDQAVNDRSGGKEGGGKLASSQSQHGKGERGPYRAEGPPFPNWPALWSRGTDAVLDVPIGGVCEVLYGLE